MAFTGAVGFQGARAWGAGIESIAAAWRRVEERELIGLAGHSPAIGGTGTCFEGESRSAHTQGELERLFRESAAALAQPSALVNRAPDLVLDHELLSLSSECWRVRWARDLSPLTPYGIADALGYVIAKRFDSPTTGITYAVRGVRSGLCETPTQVSAMLWTAPGCPAEDRTLEQERSFRVIAIRYPTMPSGASLREYVRFLSPSNETAPAAAVDGRAAAESGEPAAAPSRAVGLLYRGSKLEAAFLLERSTEKVHVRLSDPALPGLGPSDLKRLFEDPRLTAPPEPCAFAGTWEGHVLVKDGSLPGLYRFRHQAWHDPALGMVGTYRWPILHRHGGMLVLRGANGMRLARSPATLREDLRVLRGAPHIMIDRFSVLLSAPNAPEDPGVAALSRVLGGTDAAALGWLSDNVLPSQDQRGGVWLESFAVLVKVSDSVDARERSIFVLDSSKLERARLDFRGSHS